MVSNFNSFAAAVNYLWINSVDMKPCGYYHPIAYEEDYDKYLKAQRKKRQLMQKKQLENVMQFRRGFNEIKDV